MNVLNKVGSAATSLYDLIKPTGSLTKDIRNAAILGAVISTAVCVEQLAKICFAEGIKKDVEEVPLLLLIGIGVASLPIAPIALATFTKMKESSPAQFIGNQLNRHVVTPFKHSFKFYVW